MIQRIQSVYLLLVTVLLVVAICMPVGQFIGADGVTAHVFKPLGVALADGGFQSTWGLFGILLLSALVAFCTIFLFRNRVTNTHDDFQQHPADRLLHSLLRIYVYFEGRFGCHGFPAWMGALPSGGSHHPQLSGLPCHLQR